ncbi:MAG TPA: tonB-system energizer ExbB [Pseudolabrys sp.]|nr:tonB-system energizer ExbB [Pseudolabrys sp.]
MTPDRHNHRAMVAAFVAVALVLPAPVYAQTVPAATTSSPAASQAPMSGSPTTPNSAVPAPTDPAAVSTALPAAAQAPNYPDIALRLPRDLSPWGMFMSADIVVKAVMVGLAFASVLTWTIWFAKAIELMTARRRLRAAIERLSQARSWSEANTRTKGRDGGVAALLRAADTELRMSADALSPAGVKERIASRLERIEAAAGRQMIRGTGILATIGATAPFVGLFGTVWGIMNSFIGISKSHTTNLAVVAPGIAEALLATALGLVAAIPAVVMYNMFSRWIAGYRALHADAAAEILRIVSRDLDRGSLDERPGDRRRAIAAE